MPMNLGGKQLSNGDIAVGAGLLVGLIAIFLPWYSYSYTFAGIAGVVGGQSNSASVGGFNYWSGIFFFIFTLIGIALWVLRTFVPTVNLPSMPLTDSVTYMVVGGVMLLMALLWLLAGAPGSYSGAGYSAGVSFGLYIGLIAAVAVVAGGFLKRTDPQPATRPFSSYQTPPTAPPPPPAG